MVREYYFIVTNNVTNKTITVLAYDKFSAIQRMVEKDDWKFQNSQYTAKIID